MNYLKYTGFIIIIILWAIVSYLDIVSKLLLPSPLDIGYEIYYLISQGLIINDLLFTLLRTVFSFVFSFVIGVLLGLAMGYNKNIYSFFELPVDFFRSIPAIALFPLFVLFLGIEEMSRVAVAIYGATLIMVINTIYGVLNASVLRKRVGELYGLSKTSILVKIIFPDALPHILAGGRIALSLSLVLTIVVEMLTGVDTGLGGKIFDFHLEFEISKMYATIIITGTIGYFLNTSYVSVENKILHWKRG